MSPTDPPAGPEDLPPPTPLPPVQDSPLNALADATPAPLSRPAARPVKKVVKKVVKKAVKKGAGSAPVRPVQAKASAPTGATVDNPRNTGRVQAVKAAGATKAVSSNPGRRSAKEREARPSRSRPVDPVDVLLDDRKSPPPPRTFGTDAQASLKGLIVIGLAVAVGFVLLSAGYSREGTVLAGRQPPPSETTTSTASPFNTTTSAEPTVTSAVKLKPVSEITVQVVNVASTKLAGTPAGDATRKLSDAGYGTKSAMDGPDGPATAVYYTGSLKAEAEEVAKVLKINPEKVAEMPSPKPSYAEGADVVVALGPDYAPSSQA